MKYNQNIYFLGIGAQKSGTTWLYKRLNELPATNLPYIKELHYFDRDPKYHSPNILSTERHPKKTGTKLIIRALRQFKFQKAIWFHKWYNGEINDKWYKNLFGNKGVRGEITPSYAILNLDDIQKIKNLLPNVKIIFLVRNPIERAWSHYVHHMKINNLDMHDIPPLDFMVDANQTLRSNYVKTLENYLEVFGSNQILIGFFDAITANPLHLMESICEFLEIKEKQVGKYCKIRERNHISDHIEMPIYVYNFLKSKYELDIKHLSNKYGSYFSVWENKTYNSNLRLSSLKPTIIL